MTQGPGPERGETLLELLIALAVMAIAVVAVVGGLASGIAMSGVHRNQSTAGAVARDYAESVASFVAGSGYKACAAPSDYSAAKVGFDPAALGGSYAGYLPTPVSVTYWNGTVFGASCSDIGLQQLTIQVAAPDSRVTERLVVVLRKPCGTGSAC
jgi:type II secretory pathway pseudopilin PulG